MTTVRKRCQLLNKYSLAVNRKQKQNLTTFINMLHTYLQFVPEKLFFLPVWTELFIETSWKRKEGENECRWKIVQFFRISANLETFPRKKLSCFLVEVVVVEIDYFKNNFTQFDSFKDWRLFSSSTPSQNRMKNFRKVYVSNTYIEELAVLLNYLLQSSIVNYSQSILIITEYQQELYILLV